MNLDLVSRVQQKRKWMQVWSKFWAGEQAESVSEQPSAWNGEGAGRMPWWSLTAYGGHSLLVYEPFLAIPAFPH